MNAAVIALDIVLQSILFYRNGWVSLDGLDVCDDCEEGTVEQDPGPQEADAEVLPPLLPVNWESSRIGGQR